MREEEQLTQDELDKLVKKMEEHTGYKARIMHVSLEVMNTAIGALTIATGWKNIQNASVSATAAVESYKQAKMTHEGYREQLVDSQLQLKNLRCN